MVIKIISVITKTSLISHYLVGGYNFVFGSLQQENRTAQRVNGFDGRTFFVQSLLFGPPPDQSVEISALEFVRVAHQVRQIGHAVDTRASLKHVSEG